MMTLDLDRIRTLLQLPAAQPSLTSQRIDGVSTLPLAGPTDLCFAEGDDQLEAVGASAAAAIIVPETFAEVPGRTLLRTARPREAFFRIAAMFVPASEVRGIHPTANIDPTATLADGVAVGAGAVICAEVRIGEHAIIGPGSYLGPGCEIGANCMIEANTSVHWGSVIGERCILHSGAVVGGDGFGFHWDGSAHRKVPQVGRVVIEDDCDIGCNSCVDRATLGETRIRRGTKIDNLVQVAHNTDIGAHVILVSQCGVAGSSRLGDGVIVSGQVAVSDHLEIGPGARIAGQSGVTKDVPSGAVMFGTPARPMKQTMRELAALAQLPDLVKQVKRQAREIEELKRRLNGAGSDG